MPADLHAEDPASGNIENLKPMVINSTRYFETLEGYAGSATVITREEIEKSGKPTVAELLRNYTSLEVVQTGPRGGSTTVFMRGANDDNTLVLIDGVQVNSNTLGSYNFANTTTDNVERIEILRGPQSTVWGADAVGGVINIITKKGKGGPSHFVSFEGGSFSTFTETAGSSGSKDNLDYSLSVSRTDSDGFSSVSGERFGATEDDGYQNLTLSGRMGYQLPGDGKIDLIGHYFKADLDIDNFQADNTPRQDRDESFNLSLPISKSIFPWWNVRFLPSYFYDVVKDAQATSESRIYNRNVTLDLQNSLYPTDYLTVVFGMEYQKLGGQNVLNGFDHDTHNNGYFLQTRFDYNNRIILNGGFRHDVNSEYEDSTTYKFEGAYRFLTTGSKIHAAYATGFKAPTFNQQFFPNFGTAGLIPEKSKGWEAGVNQDFLDGAVKLGMTYFEVRYTNLIETINTGGNNFRARNVSRAKTSGIETSITATLPYDFSLGMNHTWLEAVNGEGVQLQRRAKHNFAANLTHVWREKLTTMLGVRVRSGVRTNSTGTQRVDGYTLWHASFAYQLTQDLKLTGRIENLFDEDYEELFGFGTPGIAGYGGLVYNFN